MASAAVRMIQAVTEEMAPLIPSKGRGDIRHLVVRLAVVRCSSRYQAIALLLEQTLPDDALVLMRSLLLDSQRLQYVERNAARRDGLLLGWFSRAVDEIATQGRVARDSLDPNLMRYAEQASGVERDYRKTVQDVQRRVGQATLERFPAEGANISRSLGQPDDTFDYMISSSSSHSMISSSFRHIAVDDAGNVGISTRNSDPAIARTISARATRHMLRAWASAAAIQEWTTVRDVQRLRDSIIAKLDAGELPASD